MEYFAGIDVSLRSCALRIVDGKGTVLLERELPCEVSDIAACLGTFPHPIERVGFEAGTMKSPPSLRMPQHAIVTVSCRSPCAGLIFAEGAPPKALSLVMEPLQKHRRTFYLPCRTMRVGAIRKPAHSHSQIEELPSRLSPAARIKGAPGARLSCCRPARVMHRCCHGHPW